MSVAPNAGIVDLDNFLSPTASTDGVQGQVPKPLAGQENYVLTALGWFASGALPGQGTMAAQNANAVAITGGTIDGTAIGSTTPATGTFTTLTSPILRSATGSATTGISFETPLGAQVTVIDVGDGTRPLRLNGGSAGSVASAGIWATAGVLQFSTNSNNHSFYTGGRGATEQFRVGLTASAVNYVQVTGAATTGRPTISAQGSDTNIGVNYHTKGNGQHIFFTGAGSAVGFVVSGTNNANYFQVSNSATGNAPSMQAAGTDTNIDLILTPKGTGRVRFGTYTAGVLTPTGYVEIKDSGGTVRRLLVG